MALSSIIQGLQVVDQNDTIIGVPATSDEVVIVSPFSFSIFTFGRFWARQAETVNPTAKSRQMNFFMAKEVYF